MCAQHTIDAAANPATSLWLLQPMLYVTTAESLSCQQHSSPDSVRSSPKPASLAVQKVPVYMCTPLHTGSAAVAAQSKRRLPQQAPLNMHVLAISTALNHPYFAAAACCHGLRNGPQDKNMQVCCLHRQHHTQQTSCKAKGYYALPPEAPRTA